MKGMHFGRYLSYLLTITMGAFSLSYEFEMLDYLNSDKLNAGYLNYLIPILLSLGGLLAGLLMRMSRRNMLMLCGLLICTVTIVSTVTSVAWYVQAVEALYNICFTYLFVIILLYTKETTTFSQSGVGIACFYGLLLLGSAVVSLVVYCCHKLYPGEDLFEHTALLVLIKLMGLLPLLVQLLLLLLYYKNEPPARLVEINEEEKAILIINTMCNSHERAREIYHEMKDAADANKFSRITWANVCQCSYLKHVLMCGLLIFLRSCAGMYTWALVFPQLSTSQRGIYHWIVKLCVAVWAFMSAFFADRYSIGYQVRLGYLLIFCLNVTATLLHVLYIYGYTSVLVLAIVSALTPMPFMLLITVPVIKFTVGFLCDKAVACAIIGYSLGYICYTYPFELFHASFNEWGPFYLQLAFTLGSIVTGLFSDWYIQSQNSKLHLLPRPFSRGISVCDRPHNISPP